MRPMSVEDIHGEGEQKVDNKFCHKKTLTNIYHIFFDFKC